MSIPSRQFVNVNVPFASFVDGRPGTESSDDAGNLYEWISGAWKQTGAGGKALVSDPSIAPGLLDANGNVKTAATTALPRFANDVPNYTDHATGGAVLEAEIVERSWATGDVDGVVISAWGGSSFKGYYITLAATDIGTAQAAIRLRSTNDNTDRQRYWVGAGERVFLPFPGLQYVFMVAIDDNTTPDNNCDLVPV